MIAFNYIKRDGNIIKLKLKSKQMINGAEINWLVKDFLDENNLEYEIVDNALYTKYQVQIEF